MQCTVPLSVIKCCRVLFSKATLNFWKASCHSIHVYCHDSKLCLIQSLYVLMTASSLQQLLTSPMARYPIMMAVDFTPEPILLTLYHKLDLFSEAPAVAPDIIDPSLLLSQCMTVERSGHPLALADAGLGCCIGCPNPLGGLFGQTA